MWSNADGSWTATAWTNHADDGSGSCENSDRVWTGETDYTDHWSRPDHRADGESGWKDVVDQWSNSGHFWAGWGDCRVGEISLEEYLDAGVRTTDAGTLNGRRRVTNVLESGRGGSCGERKEIRCHGRTDRGLLASHEWAAWFGTGAGNVAIAAAAASSSCTDAEWAAWFGTGAGNVAIAAAAAASSSCTDANHMPAPLRLQCLG